MEVWFQRASDVVRKIKTGDVDMGIVGYDMLREYGEVCAPIPLQVLSFSNIFSISDHQLSLYVLLNRRFGAEKPWYTIVWPGFRGPHRRSRCSRIRRM